MSRIRVVGTVAAVLALAFTNLASPGAALAGTQGSCHLEEPHRLALWENSIGDTSDGDDKLWRCGLNTPNLAAIAHNLAGQCHPNAAIFDHWNDCIESISLWIPATQMLCIYEDANYGGDSWFTLGPKTGLRADIPIAGLSSLRYRNQGAGC